jgi:hypothetical protein
MIAMTIAKLSPAYTTLTIRVSRPSTYLVFTSASMLLKLAMANVANIHIDHHRDDHSFPEAGVVRQDI